MGKRKNDNSSRPVVPLQGWTYQGSVGTQANEYHLCSTQALHTSNHSVCTDYQTAQLEFQVAQLQ